VTIESKLAKFYSISEYVRIAFQSTCGSVSEYVRTQFQSTCGLRFRVEQLVSTWIFDGGRTGASLCSNA
jgi:hypothetical protein